MIIGLALWVSLVITVIAASVQVVSTSFQEKDYQERFLHAIINIISIILYSTALYSYYYK